MYEFNRMTIVAAAEVISLFKTHSEMELLEVAWGIEAMTVATNLQTRATSWARIAIDLPHKVLTVNGNVTLSRAIVETAISAPRNYHTVDSWKRLVAGLRFDGFELVVAEQPDSSRVRGRRLPSPSTLRLERMLPEDVPGVDFREAESEIITLLERNGFDVAKGHLRQALAAFQRGEWSGANGELRNFYEEYLNRIALELGYKGDGDSKSKRDFLGNGVEPPFLLTEYNEWHPSKPQFVQGLMNRMHPHGGHPGLSEEEDATFRLQISLVTARLFLRRYDMRKTH